MGGEQRFYPMVRTSSSYPFTIPSRTTRSRASPTIHGTTTRGLVMRRTGGSPPSRIYARCFYESPSVSVVPTRPSSYSLSDPPCSQMRVTIALCIPSSVVFLCATGNCMPKIQCAVNKAQRSALFFAGASSVNEAPCSLIGYTTVLTRVPN